MLRVRRVGVLCLIGFALLSAPGVAGAIAFEDWHLDTDLLGGLRQSTYDPSVWFAVSASTTWDPSAVYEAPVGFHWASTAEGNAIFGNNGNPSSGEYVYWGQGGWNGYRWEGQNRFFFRFSDSNVTNAYKHVGNFDEYQLQSTTRTDSFAGIVLIQDVVPEPGTGLLVGLGLASAGIVRRPRRGDRARLA